MNPVKFLLPLVLLFLAPAILAEDLILSGSGWKAWLDREAAWEEDVLYLPSELPPLKQLPVNLPTGGWEILEDSGMEVTVPLTIDEYFMGGINTNTYEGVSWVWREFKVPADWKGKVLLLKVEKARMRAEVYVNQQLAAYDIVGETPFSFDISSFVKAGKTNAIAVRLTNPGGRRHWYDGHVDWGKYRFNSSGRGFSTLGNVHMEARPAAYISDAFVKNVLPVKGRKVEVGLSMVNTTKNELEASLPVMVMAGTGDTIAVKKLDALLAPGKNKLAFEMTLDGAELWSPENPALHVILFELETAHGKDSLAQPFGLRTFQVLPGESGEHNWYLNGERFFFKSAIDWGYYFPSGDFASPAAAARSVKAAKDMGQNGISFHRAIGEPLIMEYADRLGLCIYEEPGGFHKVDTVGFSADHMKEKIRRMVIRDRNHPSVLVYNLSNEDHTYNSLRKYCLELVHALDESRLVTNSSGIPPTPTPHIRPYEQEIRTDFRDQHSAENMGPRYRDTDFSNPLHRTQQFSDCVFFLGEVNSTTGPSNWYQVYESSLQESGGTKGYDLNNYEEIHGKIRENFHSWRLAQMGSGNIQIPADVSMQAGRGMMYIHGRHAQSIMCNNHADGYALNGWTTGPQTEGSGSPMDWDSGILDEARNLKGPSDAFSYWTRPLQIAMARKNGKYFEAGDTAVFELNLINQGILGSGDYVLDFYVTDGDGKRHELEARRHIHLEGGDCFAQELDSMALALDDKWMAGYLTLHAVLSAGQDPVASGSEQILLRNRSSLKSELSAYSANVIAWPAAEKALTDVGVELYIPEGRYLLYTEEIPDFIFAGDFSSDNNMGFFSWTFSNWGQVDELLKRVDSGAVAMIQFDQHWADVLFRAEILSEPVTEWGGKQSGHWLGNGWGYLDHFVGEQSIANEGTIGTNAWEVSSDPRGFYPFKSKHPTSVYGLYLARPWTGREPAIGYRVHEVQPTVAVTLGVIEYGSGKIILNPCYQVDEDNAFTDMLFYSIMRKASEGDW